MLAASEAVRPAAPAAALSQCMAKLAGRASLEVSAKSASAAADCARWLAPGTEVFISMVPGQTYAQTIALARALRAAGLVPVPHVTARGIAGVDMANQVFMRLANAGVTHALVLGGDRVPAPGAYGCALDLLESGAPVRAGFKRLYVPGYPEGHPAIADAVLTNHLTRKLAWCAAHGIEAAVITQFSFEEAAINAWLARMAAQFPNTRVVIGVAGPAGAATLLRYAALCGVRASMGMLTRQAGKLLRVVAESRPNDVVRALARRELAGAPPVGLHLFSFGGAERTARWCHAASAAHGITPVNAVRHAA